MTILLRKLLCRRPTRVATIGAAFATILTSGCVTAPAPQRPRPALPLPAALATEFAFDALVATQSFAVVGGDRDLLHWRGELRSGDETARFHVLCALGAGPRPLVVCLPILAGGGDLMWTVASGIAARGYAAAWVERVAPALRIGESGQQLDTLFRRTLYHNRMLLRWSERRADLFAPGQRAVLGLSTGGMVGAVFLALEPGLVAGALCLAGADLPSLLLATSESRVVRWRATRATDHGLAGTCLRRELERELTVDPARFGAYVATDRVLLVHAGLDDVVPERNHTLLWESLGRPRDLRLSWLGHYTTALALDAVLDAVAEFYAARFAANAGI